MLGELAAVFLKLGMIGFGGPAAHVALMRREFVARRGWVEPDEFNRMFAACNLIPGPSSTELAIFMGHRRGGRRGMLIAGSCFLLPAALLMFGLAWAYLRWGQQPAALHLLAGVRPVVVGIMAWATIELARSMVGDWPRAGIAALAAVLLALGFAPALIVVIAGGSLVLGRRGWRASPLVVTGVAYGPIPVSLATVFLAFLKIGALSFGSGYVLVAFLRADLVKAMHWLTDPQLVDAIAIAQATPGPVFSVAAFVGYLVGGVPGCVVATAAIFLPGFALVPFMDRVLWLVQHHLSARAFVDGANAAALGLIAAVTLQLASTAFTGVAAVVTAVVTITVLWRWPLASPALIAAGAAAGLVGLI